MTDFCVSISNLIIDDILTYDDQIHIGVLGGAGPHALSGCRIWETNVGLIASAGKDINKFIHFLDEIDIDKSGIMINQNLTTRAWQIIQPGGKRIQVFRDPENIVKQLIPNFDLLPVHYKFAKGFHILWNGSDEDLIALLKELKLNSPQNKIALEPPPRNFKKDRSVYEEIFNYVNVFSPNLDEIKLITNNPSLSGSISDVLEWGCSNLVIRGGEKGSIFISDQGEILSIPISESSVVDITGAGNAYMGGLLCGISNNKSLEDSLAMAAVSAGFEIEQYGVCRFNDNLRKLRDDRFIKVKSSIRRLDFSQLMSLLQDEWISAEPNLRN